MNPDPLAGTENNQTQLAVINKRNNDNQMDQFTVFRTVIAFGTWFSKSCSSDQQNQIFMIKVILKINLWLAYIYVAIHVFCSQDRKEEC